MKKHQTLWIAGILLFLVILLILSLKLNETTRQRQIALLETAEIQIIQGQMQYGIQRDALKTLVPETFEAVLDTATSSPKTHQYTGIQLKNLLDHFEIQVKADAVVIISGADGYSVVYSMTEVLEEGKIYVAYEEDGESILSFDQGGRGPFETIVVTDPFSNRRCKWVTQIEVR